MRHRAAAWYTIEMDLALAWALIHLLTAEWNQASVARVEERVSASIARQARLTPHSHCEEPTKSHLHSKLSRYERGATCREGTRRGDGRKQAEDPGRRKEPIWVSERETEECRVIKKERERGWGLWKKTLRLVKEDFKKNWKQLKWHSVGYVR